MQRLSSQPVGAIILLLAGIVAVYLGYALTLTPDLYWGDEIHYVHHAENILSDQDYRDTDYVVNPYASRIGPANYPPGYPVFLATGKAILGDSIIRLKQYSLLAWVGFLLLFYCLARWVLSPMQASVSSLIVGFNPLLWSMHNLLLSELLYLALVTLALLIHEHINRLVIAENNTTDRPLLVKWQWVWALALGLAIYAAYATRSLGIVLLPTVIVADLWRAWRVRLTTLVALAVAIACAVGQEVWLSAMGSYGDIVGSAELAGGVFSQLLDKGRYFAWGVMLFAGASVPSLLAIALGGALLGLAAWGGLLLLVRKQLVTVLVYCGGYVALLLLLPFGLDARRLSGVFPFVVLFAAFGLWNLPYLNRLAKQLLSATLILAFGIAAASDIAHYQQNVAIPQMKLDKQRNEMAEPLFDFIRTMPHNPHFLFRFPRTLTYYGEQTATGFYGTASAEELRRVIEQQKVTHLLEDRLNIQSEPVRALLNTEPGNYKEIWRNEQFSVYQKR